MNFIDDSEKRRNFKGVLKRERFSEDRYTAFPDEKIHLTTEEIGSFSSELSPLANLDQCMQLHGRLSANPVCDKVSPMLNEPSNLRDGAWYLLKKIYALCNPERGNYILTKNSTCLTALKALKKADDLHFSERLRNEIVDDIAKGNLNNQFNDYFFDPQAFMKQLPQMPRHLIRAVSQAIIKQWLPDCACQNPVLKIAHLKTSQENITRCILSNTHRYTVALCEDQLYAIRLFDNYTEKSVAQFKYQPKFGTKVCFNSNDSILAMSHYNKVELFDTFNQKQYTIQLEAPEHINSIHFSEKDPNCVYVTSCLLNKRFKKVKSNIHDKTIVNQVNKELKDTYPNYGRSTFPTKYCPNTHSCAPAFSFDKETYALGRYDGVIEVYYPNKEVHISTANDQKDSNLPIKDPAIKSLFFGTENALIATHRNGDILVYERNPVDTMSLNAALLIAYVKKHHGQVGPTTIEKSDALYKYYATLPITLKPKFSESLHIRQ